MIAKEKIDEDWLRAEAGWNSLADIPDFPFGSFNALRESVSQGRHSLRYDYTAARNFTQRFGTVPVRLSYILLSLIPWLAGFACLVVGPILGKYLIILGAPIALFGQFFGNPLNPIRRAATLIAGFATLLFLGFFVPTFSPAPKAVGVTGAWLLGSFVISFWANRGLYGLSRMALYKALLASEPVFLYLYSKSLCFVEDSLTGKKWWAPR